MQRSRALPLTVLGLSLAAIVLAQDKPAAQKPPEEQVGGLKFVDATEVTIVNVDVRVTDKDGQPVRGLTADDFEVYQDGKLQPVVNFAFYGADGGSGGVAAEPTPAPAPVETPAAAPAAGAAAPPAPEREPNFVALYIDNENILPFNRNRVLNRVIDWVRESLRAPDRMMVVSYQRSLKIPQPFTSDAEDVVSALRPLKRYTGGRSDVVSSRREIEEFISQNSDREGPDRAIDRARAFAREQRNNLNFTVRAIQELVNMMSGLPGNKSIIYVSDGLPMAPGLELFYEIQDRYRDPGAISRSRDFDATLMFRGLVTTASAAGVTLYSIDARGLEADLGIEAENRVSRSTLSASITRTNYQDSLIYVSEQTGGFAIINSNDVTRGLERIRRDLDTYYYLGYRLVPSGEDRFHTIEVKVKGHPDAELTYRQRFIEKSLATRIGERVMTGLAFDLGDNPLGISVESSQPTPASGDRWTLPVEVHIPIANLAMIPEGGDLVGYVMAYYAARDNEGKQSDLQRTEHTVRIPQEQYESAKSQYYAFTASLLLEPGTYRVSVGLRDELTNQAGYATMRRAVPGSPVR